MDIYAKEVILSSKASFLNLQIKIFFLDHYLSAKIRNNNRKHLV